MSAPLNTFPIESFLEKARIARKSGQKTLILSINDATMLEESLGAVMTRLSGLLDGSMANATDIPSSEITIKMDGGML